MNQNEEKKMVTHNQKSFKVSNKIEIENTFYSEQ
jgi:hypothetical protein